MDFIYLFRVLLKRKWIIIGAAVLAAAIAYILTRNEEKSYYSFSQFSTGFASDEIQVVKTNNGIFEQETKFNNVIMTMTSPTVTTLLAYQLMLHDLNNPELAWRHVSKEDQQSEIFKKVDPVRARQLFTDKLETMTMLTSYKPEERALLEYLKLYKYDVPTLKKNLNVYRIAGSDFIQIDYKSNNPDLSAFVVNNIFNQFLRYYRGYRSTTDQVAIDTLRSMMEKKKADLDAKNNQLRSIGINVSEISSSSGGADLEISIANEQGRLTELNGDLQKVNLKIASMSGTTRPNQNNEALIAARKAKNEAYNAWLAEPADKALKDRYDQLNAEYEKLYREYNSNRDNVDAPTEGLAALRSRKTDLEIDIRASQSKINALREQSNKIKYQSIAQGQQSAQAETLLKETELANKEYTDAKQRYNEATLIGGAGQTNFRQVVEAQPAIEPEPSKRKLIVGMAGAAAMMTTMLLFIFLAYMDSSVKTPVIFSKTVGLKLISMVNFANLRNRSLADIVANREKGANADDHTRNNIFRESLRKLRYEIETSGKKIFLFTSTKKGQGKTTIIQALSYSMSMSKKKILIIDTNFCNNDLTVQLNADPILEKIVPYKADGQALLEQVKVFSKDIGAGGTVYAIGSEGGDYTPSEILPRENLLHHLHRLTSEFDYIFLEGPPLNDFSDSKELAQYVDGVIAVFAANHIIKQIDKQSIGFFKELNGKFIGSILNMVDLKNVNVA
jgi:Mrp family chromosome partitioning ATPase/uncharacterized protein involved in exopolysaccharide biosynthesis